MAMAQRQQQSVPAMAGWLEEVQRDPRTMGAFRRRIESLLRDPAVARRVAGRICRLQDEGRASPSEIETDRAHAAPAAVGAVRGQVRAEVHARAMSCVATGPGASIFGRCDCDGLCCMLVPDLSPLRAKAPPILAGRGHWLARH
jgi:hypothetical protein